MLQNQFRQQYSNIVNTREQLFHAWRSFHFSKNTETLDSYITHIRQVATLLGYGRPQVLEVFKNTLPKRLYWVLFPIEDLRQETFMIDIAMIKEIIKKIWINSGYRRTSFSGRIQYGQNYRDSSRYNQNYKHDFRRGKFRGKFEIKSEL